MPRTPSIAHRCQRESNQAQSEREREIVSRSDLQSAVSELFADRERLALCLDFDGTLAPIVEEPADAALPSESRRHLESLAENPTVDIAVISGRALEDIQSRVDVPGLAYAGNHGLERKLESEVWVHPAVERRRGDLERVCRDLERKLEPISGCFVEDKYATATVHHRRADTDDSSHTISTVQNVVEGVDGLSMTVDDQAVEIRPAVDHHKGDAVEALVDIDSRTAVVYLGDAETDIDAFRRLADRDNETLRASVGGELPATGYHLDSPAEVEAFLSWLRGEVGDSSR